MDEWIDDRKKGTYLESEKGWADCGTDGRTLEIISIEGVIGLAFWWIDN